MIIYISLIPIKMTHLQNKTHGFQQTLNKSRNQYAFHHKFKCQPFQAEPNHNQLYYSDQEGSVKKEPQQRGQIENMINQAQGQIERNYPKEEAKVKKGKSSKKKSGKSKIIKPVVEVMQKHQAQKKILIKQQSQNQGITESEKPKENQRQLLSMHQSHLQNLQTQSQNIPQKQPQLKAKASFRTIEQNQLNRLQGKKARIDKKFVSTLREEGRSRLSKQQICFKYMSEYRAYFQKETQMTYDQYLANCQSLKSKAIQAKIKQLVRLQKQSKLNLIKKVQSQNFKHQRGKNIIESIIQQPQNTTNQVVMTNSKGLNPSSSDIRLNQSFTAINKFLQHAQRQQNPIVDNKSPSKSFISQDSQIHQKRKNNKAKSIEPNDKQNQPSLPTYQQPSKNLQIQLSQMNDRKKILASIQIVNKKCDQHQKNLRIETQRQEKERQEKQKSKVPKKEQTNPTPQQSSRVDASQQNQSQRRRQQNLREAHWYNYHKSNPKIKRLQILNRYHYNPFQQNQGQDQCELWKKLMGMEIKNLRYDSSVKNQQVNQHLIDQLLKDAQECDRQMSKLNKLNSNDIFILPTNYKPTDIDGNNDEEEEIQKQKSNKSKKSKSIKKSKKSAKNKKNKQSKQTRSLKESQQAPNNSIDDFLDFGGTPSKNISQQDRQQDFIQPYKIQTPRLLQQKAQQKEKESNFQQAVQHLISNNNQGPFNYEQLADLQINDQIKKESSHDEPPSQYYDIQFLQKLAQKQRRR